MFKHLAHFVIASAGTNGIVFGSKSFGKIPGFVHFYSLNDILPRTWDIILPLSESVQVNCVCDQFVIVGTSTNILRIFSIGGVEEASILIPGKLITSCSHGVFFAIVFKKSF